MQYSTRIYKIYLNYVAPEDIHVYSVDEVFIDATSYLDTYGLTAAQLAKRMIRQVFQETGITATAGIGTNLYLCKVAMDIMAKHTPPDEDGVRIAQLDERSYRERLWEHRPLTDFWRVGPGYARKLEQYEIYTMGDIARCSLGAVDDFYREELLYQLFGVNAELLIDHAWGWEPCTIADIKAYQPESSSLGSGQVLSRPYDWKEGRLVVHEMTDLLVLDLVDKGLVTDQMVLTIGYDKDSLQPGRRGKAYQGEVTTDRYGRRIPKHTHGTISLGEMTSSGRKIIEKVLEFYDSHVNPDLLIRRLNIVANHVQKESEVVVDEGFGQMDLFTDYAALERQREQERKADAREKQMQHAVLDLKKKFGKNAVLKGMNLEEGATARERNASIGGHKA